MTTRKKKRESKGPSKTEKLALNKETLKDLTPDAKANNVRGGRRPPPEDGKCTWQNTGCTDAGE